MCKYTEDSLLINYIYDDVVISKELHWFSSKICLSLNVGMSNFPNKQYIKVHNKSATIIIYN